MANGKLPETKLFFHFSGSRSSRSFCLKEMFVSFFLIASRNKYILDSPKFISRVVGGFWEGLFDCGCFN
jgi:hypothetical protein